MSKLESGRPSDPVALYPEYKEKLTGNYCTSLEPYTKIWELVPFRECLIVHINVELKSEREFAHWYGASVDDLLSLQENGQAVIMINLPPRPVEVPDYLDPILERKFPTSRRIVEYTDEFVPTTHEAGSLGEEVVRLFTAKSDASIDTMLGDPERIKRTTETLVHQLLAMGERDRLVQIRDLLLKGEILRARRDLEFYRLSIVGPTIYSLSGFHTVSWKAVANNPSLSNNALTGKVEFFSPAGAVLVKKLNLYKPASFGEAIDARHDYDKARKALKEFEAYLRSKGTELFEDSDSSQLLSEIGGRFDEIIHSFEARKKMVDVIFIAGSIASSILESSYVPILALAAAENIDGVMKIACGKQPIHHTLLSFAIPKGLRSFFSVYESRTGK